MLIGAIERKEYGGAYWGINTRIGDYPLTPRAEGYAEATLAAIASIRTDLNVFKTGEQSVLMNHGWLLSGAALRSRCPEWPGHAAAGFVPDANLLDNAKALAALRA
jgi:hypothetical protein